MTLFLTLCLVMFASEAAHLQLDPIFILTVPGTMYLGGGEG